MVLGQEQDIVGGNFTVSEAFYGHLSQMNVLGQDIKQSRNPNSCKFLRSGSLW